MIEYFGLSTIPFTKEIRSKDRYQIPFIEQEIKSLTDAIEARMSALLLAPAGTGKTSILRAIREKLPEARYHVHYVKVTALSKRDMCREIARSIGAKPAGTYASLVSAVQARLDDCYSTESVRPVLLIDEAHDMRPEVLSMLRILTNFDMDSKLVVSLILSGQPPLKQKLFSNGLEDIRRRLIHCGELRLLSREETTAYLGHRITIAGGRKSPFDDGATDAIYEMARGNMRAIDHISYNALKIAADRKIPVIDQTLIAEARKNLWI